jgi:hypothetical protein
MGLKIKTARNRKYLDWVKTLPSCISGRPADDPHHIIGRGEGGMGTKASDYFAIPLTRDEHSELHHNPNDWEDRYGEQWKFVAKTLETAINTGIIKELV